MKDHARKKAKDFVEEKTPAISDKGFYSGGPSVSRTQHQRILVCVAFTTPWTMPSPWLTL